MKSIISKGLRDKTTLNLQNESDGSSRDPDEEANDCIKDRKNALEDKSVSTYQIHHKTWSHFDSTRHEHI